MPILRAFFRGLLGPSLPGTLGGLGLGAALLAWLCTAITPASVGASDPNYLLRWAYDHDSWVTVDAMRVRYHDTEGPGVVYLGASGKRAAIHSAETAQEALRESLRTEVDFLYWCTAGQTLWESGLLIDQLPETYRGVVVIGVGPMRLSRDQDTLQSRLGENRLALPPSEFIRREAELDDLTLPDTTGIYLLDNAGFFVRRYQSPLRGWLRGDWYQPHSIKGRAKEERWVRYEEQIAETRADLQSNRRRGYELLGRVVELVRQHPGLQPVLLESPLPQRAIDLLGPPYEAYLEEIQSLAERLDLPYLVLDAEVEDSHFKDWTHISDARARMRFEQALIDALVPYLEDSP